MAWQSSDAQSHQRCRFDCSWNRERNGRRDHHGIPAHKCWNIHGHHRRVIRTILWKFPVGHWFGKAYQSLRYDLNEINRKEAENIEGSIEKRFLHTFSNILLLKFSVKCTYKFSMSLSSAWYTRLSSFNASRSSSVWAFSYGNPQMPRKCIRCIWARR